MGNWDMIHNEDEQLDLSNREGANQKGQAMLTK